MRALYVVLTLVLAAPAFGADECTQRDGYTAETVVDFLDSWRNVHLAFKEFAQCDDGGVAEGYSDAVVKLLAKEWSKLGELTDIIARDPAFEGFVLKHIDATTDDQDLAQVEKSATTRCPGGQRAFCSRVAAAANRALADIRKAT